ncbi:unnamed protein product, partial [Vitis vinifera]
MMRTKKQSHCWWFDSHNSPRRSPWLQSTLAELDEKTKAMLKIIEEDADSFGRRAEMYYKKRPELINMVEDFYRAHRSLAERYDQVRSDPGARLGPTLKKLPMRKLYDSGSETFDSEESGESEVDDPEQEDDTQLDEELGEEEEVSSGISNVEVMKLREEIERLKEENKIQKDQLMQKDEEKREVIRQLSLAVQVLKEENVSLRKSATKASPKKWSPIELNKLKASFLGKLFIGPRPSVVAL